MNLSKLYQTINQRENINPQDLRVKQRVGFSMPHGYLDIMKIDQVGRGRPSTQVPYQNLALAKVCPGQAAMRLCLDGKVHLNELLEVEFPGDLYCSSSHPEDFLGILRTRHQKGYWIEVNAAQAIKPVTKSEMRLLHSQLRDWG